MRSTKPFKPWWKSRRIYPADNTVASAIGAVVKVCNRFKIPVIGAERGHVEGGALTTLGIDYYLLGKQTETWPEFYRARIHIIFQLKVQRI